MTLESMLRFKETRGDTLGFVQAATPEQLLEIAARTALRGHPLVKNFNDPNAPAYYQKADDLRRLIIQEMKRHADFRGMAIQTIFRMQPQEQGSEDQDEKKGKQEAKKPEKKKPEQKKEK